MTPDEVIETLKRVGAILDGHFLLSSGRHSDTYVEKFRAFERPEVAMDLGAALAEIFENRDVSVVLSPAVGAVVFGFAVAARLGARFVFSERDGGRMTLRRGFEIAPSERVLVVEDVVTTGGSLKEVIDLAPPGVIAGVACLVDRTDGLSLDPPLTSLARLRANSWEPGNCPLCAKGIPLKAPGSRHLL